MLASLLPGLRELRAPLAAGYLWLLLGWLIFEPLYSDWDQTDTSLEALTTLFDKLTPVGLGIIASFVAYLLGVLTTAPVGAILDRSVSLWQGRLTEPDFRYTSVGDSWFRSRLAEIRHSRLTNKNEIVLNEVMAELQDVLPQSVHSYHSMKAYLMFSLDDFNYDDVVAAGRELGKDYVRELGRAEQRERGLPEQHVDRWPIGSDIKQELGSVANEGHRILVTGLGGRLVAERSAVTDALLEEKQDVYAALDRIRGEAEFRSGLLLPLFSLIVYLAAVEDPIWLLGLLGAGVLAIQSVTKWREYEGRIIGALTRQPSRSPTLNRMEASLRASREQALDSLPMPDSPRDDSA